MMRVDLSPVSRESPSTASGWQQAVTYEHNGRTRKEIFCGRTRGELDAAVAERVGDLRRSNGRNN